MSANSERAPSRGLAVRLPGREVALGSGEHFIGREPSCSLRLEDDLVSRRHAKIVVSADSVMLFDLGSANGVFVNECRIRQPMPLEVGDRIIIGTQQLVIVESSLTAGSRVVSDVVPAVPSSRPPSSGSRPSATSPTARADAFQLFGKLADRMLRRGDATGAARLLSGHVNAVLRGAKVSPVPDELIDVASRYCLKVAAATADAAWVDRVVELHLTARRPMATDTLVQMSLALRAAKGFDRGLLVRYRDTLRDLMDSWTDDDRALARAVLDLVLPPV